MKNTALLIALVIILLAVAGVVLFKQSTIPPRNPPTNGSSDFNLIFKYGVGAKNELNTFDQTYTKDMVMNPSVTIKFNLTDNELMGIEQKINELKLFDKNKVIATGNEIQLNRIPCSSFYLKAQIDSTQKELSWDDCHGKVSDKLQQFTNYIIPIIESNDEYKKLPTPTGGYY